MFFLKTLSTQDAKNKSLLCDSSAWNATVLVASPGLFSSSFPLIPTIAFAKVPTKCISQPITSSLAPRVYSDHGALPISGILARLLVCFFPSTSSSFNSVWSCPSSWTFLNFSSYFWAPLSFYLCTPLLMGTFQAQTFVCLLSGAECPTPKGLLWLH